MTAIQNSRRLAHPSFVSGARDLSPEFRFGSTRSVTRVSFREHEICHPSFVSGARDLFRCAQADKIIESIAKKPIKHSVKEDMLKETV